MVVIHRAHGCRLVIYRHEHEPAHVHIVGPGLAKVHLLGSDGGPHLVGTVGIEVDDLRRLLDKVAKLRDEVFQAWESIHGRSD